ncbi:Pyruvate/Phosphoenolpyruvate kinase-like domain-containing protein [Penicillium canescens]|nr:Pyruvate/Phosphoenolpyruvate kinase-like domain-containing protein [Penicillium canescens]
MIFLGRPSLRSAQVVAQTCLDAIIIDCEHGNISEDSTHSATAAIAALGVSPLVRLGMTHADLIKRALDAGAHGIVVTQINTAEEARTVVVSHSKFPPQAVRGQGSAFPAAISHGIDISKYMKTANETLITCLQIVSKSGIENVMKSAPCLPSVSHLPCRIDHHFAHSFQDMIFIGSNEFALSVLRYVPAEGKSPSLSTSSRRPWQQPGNMKMGGLVIQRLYHLQGPSKGIRYCGDELWYSGNSELVYVRIGGCAIVMSLYKGQERIRNTYWDY